MSFRKQSLSMLSGAAIDLITCEYPPDLGGVADYSRQIAIGFAELGHEVCVWTRTPKNSPIPPKNSPIPKIAHITGNHEKKSAPGTIQIVTLGSFGPWDIWRAQKRWNRSGKKHQILLQWAPTGYGLHGVNLLFPLWIALRVFQGDTLRVMFHEAFYGWHEPKLRLKIASVVQRLMLAIVLNSAKEVFVATRALTEQMTRLKVARNTSIRYLPIPSNVLPTAQGSAGVPKIAESGRQSTLVGHFGTFHPDIFRILIPALEGLMQRSPDHFVLLIGAGSKAYRDKIAPSLRDRVKATGPCPLDQISVAIDSCHFLFQPYPGGINSRHGAAVAALAHGKLLISTTGPVTEEIWKDSSAVRLLPSSDPGEMAEELSRVSAWLSRERMESIALEAKAFYERHFSIRNVMATLAESYTEA
jgi:glycosyltransferase involved in cell wall biosynthesis